MAYALIFQSQSADAQPVATSPFASAGMSERTNIVTRSLRYLPLEVILNGAKVGSWVLLEADGILFAPIEALDEWRLQRRPSLPTMEQRGITWFALATLPGFDAQIDWANQTLTLTFSSQAFVATTLAAEQEKRPALTPAIPAAFLNYDISYMRSSWQNSMSAQELGALTEIGFSGNMGVVTSSFVGLNLNGHDRNLPRRWHRLETTYTHDYPEQNFSMRIGDSRTVGGLWGRSMLFGGVQLSRNFALTPGFMTQPIPVLIGTASTPSTVDIYINDALRQTAQVPAGPFTIDSFPVFSGAGQARIVIRDLLGRETVLEQNLFSHSELLEQGLNDWSIELGATRLNLGTASSQYGERFSSGLWRYGLSKLATLEAHAELGQVVKDGGLGASIAIGGQTLIQAALSWSAHRDVGTGHQWLFGIERNESSHSYALRIDGTSPRYRWLGSPDTPLHRLQLSGSYSLAVAPTTILALGMTHAQSALGRALSSLSLNYSMRIGQRGALTFTAMHVQGATNGTAIGLSFVMPLQGQSNLAGHGTYRSGQSETYLSTSKGLAAETGDGWRVLGGIRNGRPLSEGSWYHQGNKGLITVDLVDDSAQQTLRLGGKGGFVLIDGHVMASRTIQDSFALIEVPGYSDVSVGFQGSRQTRTDAYGFALLPQLQAFTRNNILLDPSELPIGAELDSIEQVVIPPWHSGVKVTFPVRSGRSALLKIVLDDGAPAPIGAQVQLLGSNHSFIIGRRGEVFITGMQDTDNIRIDWNGAACVLAIPLPPKNDAEIVRAGPFHCQGVPR